MASNIVAKLLLDDKDYSSKLDKAKKNSKSFSQEVSTGMTKAVGGLTAALGLAGGAFVTMNKAIQSSQKTADGFDKVMRAANTSVNTFFASLSTGDFSVFNRGLKGIIEQANAAATALDQLGNTTISYGYYSSKNQNEINELLNIVKDPESTQAQIDEANAQLQESLNKRKQMVEKYVEETNTAVSAVSVEGTLLSGVQVSSSDIDEILGIDINMSEKSREEYKSEYKKFLEEMAALKSEYENVTFLYGGRNTTYKAGYGDAKQALIEQYKLAILYNKLLERSSDEQLQSIANLMISAQSANREYLSLERSINRAKTAESKTGGGTGGNLTYGVTHQAQAVDYLSGGEGVNWGTFVEKNKDNLHKSFTANEPPKINFSLPNAQPYEDRLNGIADAGINAQESLMGLTSVMQSMSQLMSGESDSWLAWASVILEMVGAFSGLGFAGVAGSAMTGGMVNFKVVGTSLIGVLENMGKHSSYKA